MPFEDVESIAEGMGPKTVFYRTDEMSGTIYPHCSGGWSWSTKGDGGREDSRKERGSGS